MRNQFETMLHALRQLCLGALLSWLALPAQAGLLYSVSIDTQALAGSNGYLDFGLVGLADSPSASVAISGLAGGSAQGSAQLDGDATAAVDGWSIGNGGAFNAVLQGWNFGTTLSFLLDFNGDWLGTSTGSGTSFAFKLWDDSWNTLLTTDVMGDLLRIELVAGGDSLVSLFAQDAGGTPSPVQIETPAHSVPEPAGLGLMLLALGLLTLRARA